MPHYPSLNFGLGETIDMLRDSVSSFTKKQIAPIAAETDEKNLFPSHMWKKLGKLGVLGITAPEEYGGANLGYLAHCVAMEEISRGSASIGLSYGAHSNLAVNQIVRNRNKNQRGKIPSESDLGRPRRGAGDVGAWRRFGRGFDEAPRGQEE